MPRLIGRRNLFYRYFEEEKTVSNESASPASAGGVGLNRLAYQAIIGSAGFPFRGVAALACRFHRE